MEHFVIEIPVNENNSGVDSDSSQETREATLTARQDDSTLRKLVYHRANLVRDVTKNRSKLELIDSLLATKSVITDDNKTTGNQFGK